MGGASAGTPAEAAASTTIARAVSMAAPPPSARRSAARSPASSNASAARRGDAPATLRSARTPPASAADKGADPGRAVGETGLRLAHGELDRQALQPGGAVAAGQKNAVRSGAEQRVEIGLDEIAIERRDFHEELRRPALSPRRLDKRAGARAGAAPRVVFGAGTKPHQQRVGAAIERRRELPIAGVGVKDQTGAHDIGPPWGDFGHFYHAPAGVAQRGPQAADQSCASIASSTKRIKSSADA